VTVNELGPSGVAFAFGRRAQAVSLQNIADGLFGNPMTQISKGADYAITSPNNLPSGLPFSARTLRSASWRRQWGECRSSRARLGAVFLQHEFQFLAQGLINLPGGPSQQLFPRHGARLPA